MKRILLLLLGLLFIVCTFHSCVQVNIGTRIREGGERRVGACANRPEGGVVYRLAGRGDEGDRYFVRAQELCYRPATPWVTAKGSPLAGLLKLRSRHNARPAQELCPTGRTVVVECERVPDPRTIRTGQQQEWEGYLLCPKALLPALPEGARPEPVGTALAAAPCDEATLGSFGPAVQEAGTWRLIAAAPFDYLLDPLLSGAASTADCLFSCLFMFYWIPNIIITGDAHPPI